METKADYSHKVEVIERYLKENVHVDFHPAHLSKRYAVKHRLLAVYECTYNGHAIEVRIGSEAHISIVLNDMKTEDTFTIKLYDGTDEDNHRWITFDTLRRNVDDLRDFLYSGIVNDDHYYKYQS